MGDPQNTFTTAGSNDGITWTNLAAGGGWAGQINAPQAFVYNSKYYFHVSTANDENINLYDWLIGLSDSTGLITTIATIDWSSQISGLKACYSGEWFQEASGTVHLFVPCSGGNSINNMAIYETHALDTTLTTWSNPAAVTVNESNIYDPKVWLIDGTYYMWLSNQSTRYVELATASTLLGPYTMQLTGNWAGWGNNKEGPTMYSTGPSTWRLAVESIFSTPNHVMYYSDCNKLDLLSCTWTALQPWTEDHNYRHGSVLKTQ